VLLPRRPYRPHRSALLGAGHATIEPGQVLDEMPLLSARTTVEDVVPRQGGSSVVVRAELPGNVFRSRFDVATGVLLDNELIQSAQGTTIAGGLRELP